MRNNSCELHEDFVFFSVYPGTEAGCWIEADNSVVTARAFEQSSATASQCERIEPIDQVNQWRYVNYVICGTKDGSRFLDSTRPEYKSGNCPPGTEKCSSKTSLENTICIEPAAKHLCPITDIRFYPAVNLPIFENNPDYDVSVFAN